MIKHKENIKKIAIASIGAIIVLLILDLTPLGGNSYYYANWIRCGNKPVHPDIAMWEGEVPYYSISPPAFAFIRGKTTYFCTAREAELAGYSADRYAYKFPHLTKEEAGTVLDKIFPFRTHG
jgi:hypothetical protein